MKILSYIKDPFKYIKLEKNRSYIWMLFTIVFGLFGIVFNVWAHLSEKSLYLAILDEFLSNSFYIFSIVLLASSAGSLFMKLNKDKMLWFSDIKLWLIIVFFIMLFISFFLSQGRDKLPGYNWIQLAFFVFSIFLCIYNFCVVNLDEHPETFAHLIGSMDPQEADNLRKMIDQSQKLSKDSKGLEL